MSLIGLTESVRGDPRKFEVWLQGRSEVHTYQAATVEIKAKWVTEIKKVLMNQLEELKDEKIKQYGNASHRYINEVLWRTMTTKLFLCSSTHKQTFEAIEFCFLRRSINRIKSSQSDEC